jgi:hypothetical protein
MTYDPLVDLIHEAEEACTTCGLISKAVALKNLQQYCEGIQLLACNFSAEWRPNYANRQILTIWWMRREHETSDGTLSQLYSFNRLQEGTSAREARQDESIRRVGG